MAENLGEWIERHGDRVTAEQQLARNNALVIVTFAEAFAASLVATALQVDQVHALVAASCIALGIGFLVLIATVLLDRTVLPDETSVLTRSQEQNWPEERTLFELKTATLTSVKVNGRVVASMRRAVLTQVLVCVAASVLAILSVLLGDATRPSNARSTSETPSSICPTPLTSTAPPETSTTPPQPAQPDPAVPSPTGQDSPDP